MAAKTNRKGKTRGSKSAGDGARLQMLSAVDAHTGSFGCTYCFGALGVLSIYLKYRIFLGVFGGV